MSEKRSESTSGPDQVPDVRESIDFALNAAGKIAEKGAGYTLLVAGMVVLMVALWLRTRQALSMTAPLTTADLGLLIGAAVILLLMGSGIRLWNSFIREKAVERELRFRSAKAKEVAGAYDKPTETPGGKDSHQNI